MAIQSQARARPTILGRVAILVGCGLGVVLFILLVGLYLATPAERIEKFGLTALLEGPPAENNQMMTPLEEARDRFNERYRKNYDAGRRPEITGTKLMLRAISEFNERERSIMIDDAVRLLRDHPDTKPNVYAMVDQFLLNNPHLAPHGKNVISAVEQQLAETPTHSFGLEQ
jgi:hypothetical protein